MLYRHGTDRKERTSRSADIQQIPTSLQRSSRVIEDSGSSFIGCGVPSNKLLPSLCQRHVNQD